MTTFEEVLRGPMQEALDRALALPDHAWKATLVRPLTAALDAAEATRFAELERLVTAVQTVAQHATLLAANGYVDADTLDVFAAAHNACLVARGLVYPPQRAGAPHRANAGVLVAACERPTLREVERDSFDSSVWGAQASAQGAAENVEAPTDELDLPVPPKPLVALEEGKGTPISEESFYADVVASCMDRAAMLARHRTERPLEFRGEVEERLLQCVDAIASIGGPCVRLVLDAWKRSLESPSPWSTWAAVFTLACLSGGDTLDAMAHGLTALPPTATDHARAAAEALLVAPHPERNGVCRTLLVSPHPVVRAVGGLVLGRQNVLGVDEIRAFLLDPNSPVAAAAAEVVDVLSAEDAARLVPLLGKCLGHPAPAVVWAAARTMLRAGHQEPYFELRDGGPRAARLQPFGAEIFVLAGDVSDRAALAACLARTPPSAATLSALARFGHAGTWSYLLRQLANEELADAAEAALVMLFGERVAPSLRQDAGAWRKAIEAMRLDSSIRYRSGEPWTAERVAEACASGALDRIALERQLDELAVRAGIHAPANGAAWGKELDRALAGLVHAARERDHAAMRGTWWQPRRAV
ncbi:hypothetical protein [Polyangium fumosum]|uniref:HEAT repeat domain-containing protein n=1 Tax=Polyangium fumosum TaxID=889272 RepID=A0A4U1JIF1_9BACT|nr:hypothetical protein [Polyangium fumosum]TKD12246.1 hypothetical protein E8A74_03825 [Polyangium fumosum]